MERDDELKVIASAKRYVLAEDAESYVVWDLEAGDEPIGRYSKDEVGFAEAQARFRSLRRTGRTLEPWQWVLVGAFALGLFCWIVAGAVQTALYFSGIYSPEGGPSEVFKVSNPVQAIGFRFWVGSLAVLVIEWLLRRVIAERKRP